MAVITSLNRLSSRFFFAADFFNTEEAADAEGSWIVSEGADFRYPIPSPPRWK